MPSIISGTKLASVSILLALAPNANAITLNVPGGSYTTIQGAIDAASAGDTIMVADGTYVENLLIDKQLTLLSENGRDFTTIQGISEDTPTLLGTIEIEPDVNGVEIGSLDQGFTIVGIDNDVAGVENAAIYFQGDHAGATIQGNDIEANGDHGFLTENGAAISDFLIDSNKFTGQTFLGPNPAGIGFGNQFTLANVPRQLVVMGGGPGGGLTSDVTFTNNEIVGTAGGTNTDGDEQGNTLVTIDSVGATIQGNTFAGTTSRYGSQLRARGPNTVISQNTFTSTNLYSFPLKATNQVYIQNTGQSVSDVVSGNDFDRGVYVDTPALGFASIGLSIKNVVVSLGDNNVPGVTINVLPGCYVESPQVHVTEDMSFVGTDRETTIITPDDDTGSGGDPRGWFLVDEGKTLEVDAMTFDGTNCLTSTTYKIYQAFRHKGKGTFADVEFKNIKFNESGPTYSGVAIAAFGADSKVNVYDSLFSDIGRIGVLYFGPTTTGEFARNTYTGKGDGDFLDYALDISAGAAIDVHDNIIAENRGVASSDGSTSACLLVSTLYGLGTTATISDNVLDGCTTAVFVGFNEADSSNVELTGNIITNAENGIKFKGPDSTGLANLNSITGNTNGFVGVDFTEEFDATCNWWGSAFGPSGLGGGPGDSVSGAQVTFVPWLLSSDIVTPDCSEVTTPRDIKEVVVTVLEEHTPTSSNIEDAAKYVKKSLEDDLWLDDITLDPKEGKKVCEAEEKAAEKLIEAGNDAPIGSVDALVTADKILVEKAYHDWMDYVDTLDPDEAIKAFCSVWECLQFERDTDESKKSSSSKSGSKSSSSRVRESHAVNVHDV